MNLFLCEPIHPKAYELINKEVHIINDINNIDKCEIIINRNIKMTAEFLAKCNSLKLMIIHGSGCDDVDVNYLKEHNIQLLNTPGLNSLSVAELIVNMMLQLARKTHLISQDFKNDKIHFVAPSHYGSFELSGKKVGFIGYGEISKRTASILKYGFNNIIYAYSRSLTKQQADEYNIIYCNHINKLLEECDFVCVNIPLNEDTYHYISDNELSLMKRSAYLINTSRGGVVDTDALYNALSDNRIAGAGIDVIEEEPISCTHPICQLDNVIYTPHIGGTTEDALERIGMKIYNYILDYKYRCIVDDNKKLK